jgi:regulatory protein
MRFKKRPAGEALDSGETGDNDVPYIPRKSAYNKMMDHLARRSFSELELRKKLSQDYAEEDVEDAVSRAREAGWLTPPEEAAERVAAELARKRKGHRYINQFLKQKGLPPVAENPDEEFSKAREFLATKLKHDFESDGPLPRELYEKAQRLLFNRGFSSETIRRTLAR